MRGNIRSHLCSGQSWWICDVSVEPGGAPLEGTQLSGCLRCFLHIMQEDKCADSDFFGSVSGFGASLYRSLGLLITVSKINLCCTSVPSSTKYAADLSFALFIFSNRADIWLCSYGAICKKRGKPNRVYSSCMLALLWLSILLCLCLWTDQVLFWNLFSLSVLAQQAVLLLQFIRSPWLPVKKL